jgi:hypothetical protein
MVPGLLSIRHQTVPFRVFLCENQNCGQKTVFACSQCTSKFYCSITCQAQDWTFSHHIHCLDLRAKKLKEKKSGKPQPQFLELCSFERCLNFVNFICSQCEKQEYCSRDCQRNDWEHHEPNCFQGPLPQHEKQE